MNKEKPKITINYSFRVADPTDYNYILRTWIMTWRNEDQNRVIPNTVFYKQANSLFRTILEKFGAIIVCSPEYPDLILGFAISAYMDNGDWVLFWIHIKSLYAQLGIGEQLYRFIKGNRKSGPIVPFVRKKMRKNIPKYGALEAPYYIDKILNMKKVEGAKSLEQRSKNAE